MEEIFNPMSVLFMWLGLETIILFMILRGIDKNNCRCPYGCIDNKSNREGTAEEPNFYGDKKQL